MTENITLPREVVEGALEALESLHSALHGAILRTHLAAEQPKPSDDVEALRLDNERLRGLLTEARGAKWLVVQDNLLDRIDAALRQEET